MSISYDHLTAAEAIAIQKELMAKVSLTPFQDEVRTIGGADISFNKFSHIVYAGIVVLNAATMEVMSYSSTVAQTSFPYIPGLLGFREVPALMQAWEQLELKPDVLVLDGHGIAHPRRLGIASHFGVVANVPTIGCAKSLLVGSYDMPTDEPFATSPLTHKGEEIGTVLRTKRKCKPVFVSPGHLVSMQQSVDIIKRCVGKYRIPEPTRKAHLLVNQLRLEHKDLATD